MSNIPQDATELWSRLIDGDVCRGEQTDAVTQLTGQFEQYPEIEPEEWLVAYEGQYYYAALRSVKRETLDQR